MKGERFESWFERKPLNNELFPKLSPRAFWERLYCPNRRHDTYGSGKFPQKVNLLFLPAYSPDFNPIEKDWANMKRALRDTDPLYDSLQTAIYNYWC
ncbi:MAG: transposase [Treponema sp.]|nr:transposase [Treponema sp.]